MARKKIIFGVGFGILSLIVDGLYGLLILRYLLQYLSKEEAGFWTLVTTAGSLLLLLQFGMGPAIGRAVAQQRAREPEEPDAMAGLFGAVRRAFGIIHLVVMGVGCAVYLLYLLPLARAQGIVLQSSIAWAAYVGGVCLNLSALSLLFIVNGLGEVGWDKVLRIGVTLLGLAGAWAALRFGGGIVGLGGVFVVQNILLLAMSRGVFRRFAPNLSAPVAGPMPQLGLLLRDGAKLMLLNLLTYLLSAASLMVVESQFGLTKVPGYTALTRVTLLVASVGSLVPQMFYPFVASAWASKDYRRCRRYYYAGIAASIGCYLIGAVSLYAIRGWFFPKWLGEGNYLGDGPLLLLLLYQFVCVHHSSHAAPMLATSGNTFGVVAMVNAALVLLLLPWMPGRFGISGVPIALIAGTLGPSLWVVGKAWRHFHVADSSGEPGCIPPDP